VHKIVYLPLANADILDAVDYIADRLDAPQAAEDLLNELDATVQRISEFPYAHELYRTTRPMRDEIRKVPVKGFVLYYAVFQDTVEIRRFLHGRRDRSAIE
jgi:toxin ParE1/3/4